MTASVIGQRVTSGDFSTSVYALFDGPPFALLFKYLGISSTIIFSQGCVNIQKSAKSYFASRSIVTITDVDLSKNSTLLAIVNFVYGFFVFASKRCNNLEIIYFDPFIIKVLRQMHENSKIEVLRRRMPDSTELASYEQFLEKRNCCKLLLRFWKVKVQILESCEFIDADDTSILDLYDCLPSLFFFLDNNFEQTQLKKYIKFLKNEYINYIYHRFDKLTTFMFCDTLCDFVNYTSDLCNKGLAPSSLKIQLSHGSILMNIFFMSATQLEEAYIKFLLVRRASFSQFRDQRVLLVSFLVNECLYSLVNFRNFLMVYSTTLAAISQKKALNDLFDFTAILSSFSPNHKANRIYHDCLGLLDLNARLLDVHNDRLNQEDRKTISLVLNKLDLLKLE